MKLLLMPFLHPNLGDYLNGKVAYIGDAARNMGDAPFVKAERDAVRAVCTELVDLPIATTSIGEIAAVLAEVGGVYVAGGEVFELLSVLRANGADRVLADAVRGGLFYAGTSAGAMIVGPSIEPASVMDSPEMAPDLKDYCGLQLTDLVVVPHAQGTTGPYTIDVISETVQKFGVEWPLLLLRDGQALYVDETGNHLI